MCKIYSENELLVLSFGFGVAKRNSFANIHTYISFQTGGGGGYFFFFFSFSKDNPNSRHYNNMVVDETKNKIKN